MRGLYAYLTPGFLNEPMWRERLTENLFTAFMAMLREYFELNN